MKRLLQFIKSNTIGFIVGIIVAGSIGVYAVSVASSDVTYDNTNSGSTATTVKAAIDELYTKVDNVCGDPATGTITYLGSQYCNNASTTRDYTVTFTDASIANASVIIVSPFQESEILAHKENGTQAAIAIRHNSTWYIANDNAFNSGRAKLTSISVSGNTLTLVINSWNTQRTVYIYAISYSGTPSLTTMTKIGSSTFNNASTTAYYPLEIEDSSIADTKVIMTSPYDTSNFASYTQANTRAAIAFRYNNSWYLANDAGFNSDRAQLLSASTPGNKANLVYYSWNTTRTVHIYTFK